MPYPDLGMFSMAPSKSLRDMKRMSYLAPENEWSLARMTEKLTKVEFTNLDKILYPDIGITKARVIEYYIRAAPKMLSVLTNRPIVLTRFPNGINKGGFYEKDAPIGTPRWVKTFSRFSQTANRKIDYIICDDVDTLVWLANLATIEIHMTLSKVDSFETPDFVVFDLDPTPNAEFNDVVEVANLLKGELDSMGLTSYVKTSGKKGLHILLPVVQEYTFKRIRSFVQRVGERIRGQTSLVVTERSEAKKAGKVYIDYVQNSHGRTMICPYSLRATQNATVSTPLEWSEVKKGLNPEKFNLFSMAEIAGNPWEDIMEKTQKLEGI
jgi:bifunctional non-homologous end joining protein LigD